MDIVASFCVGALFGMVLMSVEKINIEDRRKNTLIKKLRKKIIYLEQVRRIK